MIRALTLCEFRFHINQYSRSSSEFQKVQKSDNVFSVVGSYTCFFLKDAWSCVRQRDLFKPNLKHIVWIFWYDFTYVHEKKKWKSFFRFL